MEEGEKLNVLFLSLSTDTNSDSLDTYHNGASNDGVGSRQWDLVVADFYLGNTICISYNVTKIASMSGK